MLARFERLFMKFIFSIGVIIIATTYMEVSDEKIAVLDSTVPLIIGFIGAMFLGYTLNQFRTKVVMSAFIKGRGTKYPNDIVRGRLIMQYVLSANNLQFVILDSVESLDD